MKNQINCVTGNTLFQSKVSVNTSQVKIYNFKTGKKFITAFLYMLDLHEIKAVITNNQGLGAHLVP